MSKPKLSKPAKPGLLARLFGAEEPKAKAPQKYTGPAKSESRDPRIALAQQIKAIRARLNPQIVKLAEKVAKKGPAVTDQERATLAIELFLAQKDDDGDFAAKLKARLEEQKRRSH